MKHKNIIIGALIALAVIALAIILFVSISNRENEVPETPQAQEESETDATKFAKEYGISEDNVFVYRTADEIIKILENGTGIVYLGFPECQWCKAYVPMLNEVAKDNNVSEIYYYNISQDRKDNTENYQKIVSILEKNLKYDKEGNRRIYVPDVTFVLNGEIIGHNNESSVVTKEDGTPEQYWTEARVTSLKAELAKYCKMLKNKEGCTTTCDK